MSRRLAAIADRLVVPDTSTSSTPAASSARPAGAGHDQRLQGGRSRVVALVFEADEQEGREAGQLPEDEQREDVVAERDAEHRAHEGEERRIEAARLRMTLQVAARVQDDQRPDRR